MAKIDFELKEKKDFFNYKRSTMFNSIFFIFILSSVLNLNLWYFVKKEDSLKFALLISSASLIFSFIVFWSSKGLRLRLNRKGSHFVSIVGLAQVIYLIGWILGSYS